MGTDVHAFQYDTRSSTRTYGVKRTQTTERRAQERAASAACAHIFCARATTRADPRHSQSPTASAGPQMVHMHALQVLQVLQVLAHKYNSPPRFTTHHRALGTRVLSSSTLPTHHTQDTGTPSSPRVCFAQKGCPLPALSETMLHPPPSALIPTPARSPAQADDSARAPGVCAGRLRRASAPCVCAGRASHHDGLRLARRALCAF